MCFSKLFFKEINPFLRYARKSKYSPAGEWVCAVDYHFYLLLSEQCHLNIENDKHLLKKGTAVIIPPGTKYSFENNSAIDIVSINFDYTQTNADITSIFCPTALHNFDSSKIIEKIYFNDADDLNSPVVVDNMFFIEPLVEKIMSEYIYQKQFYREVASGTFKQVLSGILREIKSGMRCREEINIVLTYIHNHFHEDINNNKLSGLVGYHPYYLNRIIKNFTGLTIRQYIIDYRTNVAKRYLIETDFSVFEISERCGYKNFCSFSRDFKQRCGVSPTVFRRNTQHIL